MLILRYFLKPSHSRHQQDAATRVLLAVCLRSAIALNTPYNANPETLSLDPRNGLNLQIYLLPAAICLLRRRPQPQNSHQYP
jgi:hypothetical protein